MFSRVGVPWIESRCAVTSVAPTPTGGSAIHLAQPCWDWFMARGCQSHAPFPCAHAPRSPTVGGGLHPRRIENVPAALGAPDQAGRFATAGATVFYALADGETAPPPLATAGRHALIEGEKGVASVAFAGVTFEMSARGPRPDSATGHMETQSGYHSVWANDSRAVPGTETSGANGAGERSLAGIAAAVHFDAAHGVSFSGCVSLTVATVGV